MKKEEILQRYFELSDTAGQNLKDFESLISLFDEEAEITAADGSTSNNIRKFFKTFFERNIELHHLFNVTENKADWAVVGRNKEGNVFALSGRDRAEFANGKIIKLKVEVKGISKN